MQPWTPDSWKTKTASQQPEYRDAEHLARVVAELERMPPLITSWEVETLREQLAEAANGERFLLQGGDCAETFDDCSSEVIAGKLKVLLQMSLVLVHGRRQRVVRVGRIAGQYAKPRSVSHETRDEQTLPSYRGDLVNHPRFTADGRTADPSLLLRGYERAALTLNFIRALIDGGFADLHHPEFWDLEWVSHSPLASEYQKMVASIGESLRFMEVLSGERVSEMSRVDFFTSHEGLHLLYEQARTREVPRHPGWYNTSTHMPWIGKRTTALEEAHVEYFRGIQNPIGLKIGADMTPAKLGALLERLDPKQVPGRITLIHRFGEGKVATCLPGLIEVARQGGRKVLWCCDPMHGNTVSTVHGQKTRRFDSILAELEEAFEVHARADSYLGGVHIELTGENVTECVGGARGLKEEDLSQDYRSSVDPRLNYEQALELAMVIAGRAS